MIRVHSCSGAEVILKTEGFNPPQAVGKGVLKTFEKRHLGGADK